MHLRGRTTVCSPKPAFSIMRSRFIRLLLVFEFLIAIEVWLTFWSQVGGQYHLDLMLWPWKFCLTVAGAGLITGITAELFRGVPERQGGLSRRAIVYAALLFVVMVTAGLVTYYYHMNEPADDNNDGGDTPAGRITRLGKRLPAPSAYRRNS